MTESCKESTIQQDDWGQLAADGGSNANLNWLHDLKMVDERAVLISTFVIRTRMSALVGMHQELSSLQIAVTRCWGIF